MKAQLLSYNSIKSADKLWSKIKQDMAAEKELKARSLNELSNIKMAKTKQLTLLETKQKP